MHLSQPAAGLLVLFLCCVVLPCSKDIFVLSKHLKRTWGLRVVVVVCVRRSRGRLLELVAEGLKTKGAAAPVECVLKSKTNRLTFRETFRPNQPACFSHWS